MYFLWLPAVVYSHGQPFVYSQWSASGQPFVYSQWSASGQPFVYNQWSAVCLQPVVSRLFTASGQPVVSRLFTTSGQPFVYSQWSASGQPFVYSQWIILDDPALCSGPHNYCPLWTPPLGAIGKQGSKEYDVSQLMKDLCDSMERENDLRDQLKFTEEESKMLRKRVSSTDEENEYLRLQLQKMSEKASKHKKKEKETQRELEVEKKHSESIKAALLNAHEEGSGGLSDDVILIVGSDVIEGDEPIPISQRKDSTDEDLMNVMQLRVQLEMVEQELMTSHKKLDNMDLENENLQAEVKFLQERLAEKEIASAVTLAEPSTPNAYYEDKLRELSQEADELRWKLIEKDREIERLSVVQTRHLREHSHKKDDKLKKSKSLDTETDVVTSDLRKHVDSLQIEVIRLRQKLEEAEEKTEELRVENEDLKNRTPIPSVKADDAPLENIELRDRVRKLDEENKLQAEKIKMLTENLQKLSRDTRSYTSIATSPTTPGKRALFVT
ncbi:hypothetical protein Btru_015439 [Bulinus truncatus]|nr:hypothetical protein Btru_015439 [Bulinus truncatus]